MTHQQCTAKSKQSGVRCRRTATPGHRVCASHGSKSRRGIAHPGLTHARYSKSLPARLVAQYAEALADPTLLALTEEIALTDARLEDLVRRVDSGESGRTWRALGQTMRALNEATRRRNKGEARIAMERLETLIARGLSDEAAWADIRALLEQRRKLVESERNRLVAARHMVPVEEVMVLVRALTVAVRTHVRDPETMHAVVAEIERLVGRDGPPSQASRWSDQPDQRA